MKFARCETVSGSTGFKVAIVGAGPAGLSAAGELACKGHEVEVFDRLPEPGGMLMFAIPDFRFPKNRVKLGISKLKDIGVVFRNEIYVSGSMIKRLLSKYDAVIIATGTWKSRRLGIEGENLKGVEYALNWIHRYMLGKLGYSSLPEPPGNDIVVVGAGLTALDVCELLFREYEIQPLVIYRRPLKIAPGGALLNRLLKQGIIRVLENSVPVKIIGKESVEGIVVSRVKPTVDRSKPIEVIPGTEQVINVDGVIVAAGLLPTPPPSLVELGVIVSNGKVKTDERMMTNVEGLFAAGDVATGPSTVYRAMQSGKKAAEGVHEYLLSRK